VTPQPARLVAFTIVLCGQLLAQPPLQPIAGEREAAEPEAPAELEPVSVTGTRIRGGDPNHLPLSVLDRHQLEATGALRLSEALRRLPWNNLGAQDQGFNFNGRNTMGFVDLRGAGANRTLVLVNGRRLALSPEANGEVANINNLPLAAVERVEVLRDGASAVYGSDAIGGVVNVILRERFQGWEAGIGFTHADWGGDEQRYSLGGGRGGQRGQFLWSLESTRRDSIHAADAFADPAELIRGLNPTGEPGTWVLSDWFGDGSLVPGPWNAEPDCPPERVRRFRDDWVAIEPGTGLPVPPQPRSFCALKFSETHDFAPSVDANHLYLRGEWDLNPRTRLFGQALYSRLESASTLTLGGDLPDAIGIDNPINPSWDPETGRARSPVTVYFGLFQLGERQRATDSRYLGLLAGGSTLLGRGELEYGLQHDEDRYGQSVGNLALRDALRDAIALGLLNPFESMNDPTVVESLRYTQRDHSKTAMTSADLTWRADWPGTLPGDRRLATVAGLEVRHESFEHHPDPEDVALNVFGYVPGGIDADADRNVWSAFVEAGLDPGPRSQLVYSARYDRYELPSAGETTHKLSWSWQPLDPLTLRAGWGQGFRAPSLVELYAPQVPNLSLAVLDVMKCKSTGLPPAGPFPPPSIECFPVALLTFEAANRDLEPEHSENWNLGFVLEPLAWLRLELDYWSVEVEDRITTPSAQEILDLEAVGILPPGSSVLRDAGGFARQVTRGRLNVPRVSIRGVDLSVDASLAAAPGEFHIYSWWSFLETYEVQTLPTSPVMDRVGGPDAPRWKSRSGVAWRRGPLGLELTVNGVASFGSDFYPLAEWWSYDAQLAWSTPWAGEVTVGLRNLTDLQPGTYEFRHHDYGGRTWYLGYRHSF